MTMTQSAPRRFSVGAPVPIREGKVLRSHPYVIEELADRPRFLGVNREGFLTWYPNKLDAMFFISEEGARDYARDRLSEKVDVKKHTMH